ncbi:putative Zn-binding protein involved in type VI secretion [Pseudoduganella flava]|uniref:PAAR domain-containing protein n=1 Tax=Pseudoduganella flava TaxID=871742 RepID=A0A562PK01_9BURK|nr:PAAR domain-containing protein [Pseudoduganella flava]QGZ42212.1 PAAR domain-containing protein [Pseudoduganella flava]TWI44747.1 putative Zn-binding protein involved in type VI secretion [Pseudoduganella flava]
MKGVIRLNDPTTHGGRVVSAAPKTNVMGVAVARQGDRCMCPLPGHTVCIITEGDPNVTIDGVPVAFEGHKTSCGASLISTMPKSGRG